MNVAHREIRGDANAKLMVSLLVERDLTGLEFTRVRSADPITRGTFVRWSLWRENTLRSPFGRTDDKIQHHTKGFCRLRPLEMRLFQRLRPSLLDFADSSQLRLCMQVLPDP